MMDTHILRAQKRMQKTEVKIMNPYLKKKKGKTLRQELNSRKTWPNKM